MNSPAVYVAVATTFSVPLISWFSPLRDSIFALFRLSSSMIGTPWP